MKNIKTIFACIVMLQIGLSSCKKQENEKIGGSADVKKFAEIKANKNFTWSTTRLIQLNFKSNPTDSRVAVLKVVDAKGIVYFKKLQYANQKFMGSIEVPNHVNTLKYIYGGIQKEFSTQAGVVNVELK
jgi:hypothetical protein